MPVPPEWALVSPWAIEIFKPHLQKVIPGLLTFFNASQKLEITEAEQEQDVLEWMNEVTVDSEIEHQRNLARQAMALVDPVNFITPAIPLAARIFLDSQFEQEGSLTWGMWVQLLARACDKNRRNEAHPSFISIISSLSEQEMALLEALHFKKGEPRQIRIVVDDRIIDKIFVRTILLKANGEEVMPRPPENSIDDWNFWLENMKKIGLLTFKSGIGTEAHLPFGLSFQKQSIKIDMTLFGVRFMDAISSKNVLKPANS